ncbi:MAG: hypothetical protein NVS3B20_15930 [Polyangiales bacterium]
MGQCGASPKTPLATAVAATIREMASTTTIAAKSEPVIIPPVRHAWVRRVLGHDAWVYFDFDDQEIVLITMSLTRPMQ